jgi:hypothetical protein
VPQRALELVTLATWNVALPTQSSRRERLRTHTDRVDADVWVLSETHDSFNPGHPFAHSSAAGRDGEHEAAHRWVTIWSRHPIETIATNDVERTAAVRVSPAASPPFVVYGSVLPWLGSLWRGYPSADGVAFREALSVQRADWVRLRDEYPDDEFFVLGDLNQDLVTPRYYSSRANRQALENALSDAGLVPLTAGDADPMRRDSAPHASIDHICARRDSSWCAQTACRWPELAQPDDRLADHFGVAISFAPRS